MVQVHCVAHRGALAIGDAAKNVEYTDKIFKKNLKNLFKFFNNSPVHEAALHNIQVFYFVVCRGQSLKLNKGGWVSD